ncbi:hypothetical protein BESB_073690 [Besnoitia besnoiti]|uniref:Eukaryotic initiation factor 4E n=1 Tax=Besnoitia besnoiti TaxID=94643 RepID=A0A2A9MF08_BESBE|nr:uncharacterized protein BESB_073690 [Besnoitia besnoiti]PFH34217.1 hypothetical protein BESB_073690 [Besnoitia besnoiti]
MPACQFVIGSCGEHQKEGRSVISNQRIRSLPRGGTGTEQGDTETSQGVAFARDLERDLKRESWTLDADERRNAAECCGSPSPLMKLSRLSSAAPSSDERSHAHLLQEASEPPLREERLREDRQATQSRKEGVHREERGACLQGLPLECHTASPGVSPRMRLSTGSPHGTNGVECRRPSADGVSASTSHDGRAPERQPASAHNESGGERPLDTCAHRCSTSEGSSVGSCLGDDSSDLREKTSAECCGGAEAPDGVPCAPTSPPQSIGSASTKGSSPEVVSAACRSCGPGRELTASSAVDSESSFSRERCSLSPELCPQVPLSPSKEGESSSASLSAGDDSFPQSILLPSVSCPVESAASVCGGTTRASALDVSGVSESQSPLEGDPPPLRRRWVSFDLLDSDSDYLDPDEEDAEQRELERLAAAAAAEAARLARQSKSRGGSRSSSYLRGSNRATEQNAAFLGLPLKTAGLALHEGAEGEIRDEGGFLQAAQARQGPGKGVEAGLDYSPFLSDRHHAAAFAHAGKRARVLYETSNGVYGHDGKLPEGGERLERGDISLGSEGFEFFRNAATLFLLHGREDVRFVDEQGEKAANGVEAKTREDDEDGWVVAGRKRKPVSDNGGCRRSSGRPEGKGKSRREDRPPVRWVAWLDPCSSSGGAKTEPATLAAGQALPPAPPCRSPRPGSQTPSESAGNPAREGSGEALSGSSREDAQPASSAGQGAKDAAECGPQTSSSPGEARSDEKCPSTGGGQGPADGGASAAGVPWSKQLQEEYEQCLERVAKLSSWSAVTPFLAWWLPASAIRGNLHNLCLFKNPVKPLWEHPDNIRGGHFALRRFATKATVQEMFHLLATTVLRDEHVVPVRHCNGIVLCVRQHWRKHKIEFWTASLDSGIVSQQESLLRRLLTELPEGSGLGVELEFVSHRELVQRNHMKVMRARGKLPRTAGGGTPTEPVAGVSPVAPNWSGVCAQKPLLPRSAVDLPAPPPLLPEGPPCLPSTKTNKAFPGEHRAAKGKHGAEKREADGDCRAAGSDKLGDSAASAKKQTSRDGATTSACGAEKKGSGYAPLQPAPWQGSLADDTARKRGGEDARRRGERVRDEDVRFSEHDAQHGAGSEAELGAEVCAPGTLAACGSGDRGGAPLLRCPDSLGEGEFLSLLKDGRNEVFEGAAAQASAYDPHEGRADRGGGMADPAGPQLRGDVAAANCGSALWSGQDGTMPRRTRGPRGESTKTGDLPALMQAPPPLLPGEPIPFPGRPSWWQTGQSSAPFTHLAGNEFGGDDASLRGPELCESATGFGFDEADPSAGGGRPSSGGAGSGGTEPLCPHVSHAPLQRGEGGSSPGSMAAKTASSNPSSTSPLLRPGGGGYPRHAPLHLGGRRLPAGTSLTAAGQVWPRGAPHATYNSGRGVLPRAGEEDSVFASRSVGASAMGRRNGAAGGDSALSSGPHSEPLGGYGPSAGAASLRGGAVSAFSGAGNPSRGGDRPFVSGSSQLPRDGSGGAAKSLAAPSHVANRRGSHASRNGVARLSQRRNSRGEDQEDVPSMPSPAGGATPRGPSWRTMFGPNEEEQRRRLATQMVSRISVKSIPDYFSMQLAANLRGASFGSAAAIQAVAGGSSALPASSAPLGAGFLSVNPAEGSTGPLPAHGIDAFNVSSYGIAAGESSGGERNDVSGARDETASQDPAQHPLSAIFGGGSIPCGAFPPVIPPRLLASPSVGRAVASVLQAQLPPVSPVMQVAQRHLGLISPGIEPHFLGHVAAGLEVGLTKRSRPTGACGGSPTARSGVDGSLQDLYLPPLAAHPALDAATPVPSPTSAALASPKAAKGGEREEGRQEDALSLASAEQAFASRRPFAFNPQAAVFRPSWVPEVGRSDRQEEEPRRRESHEKVSAREGSAAKYDAEKDARAHTSQENGEHSAHSRARPAKTSCQAKVREGGKPALAPAPNAVPAAAPGTKLTECAGGVAAGSEVFADSEDGRV